MSSSNRLTFKRRRFAEEYVKNNGNGTQAALKVYDTDNHHVAQTIASENMSIPVVQRTVEEIAKSVGITSDIILQRFNNLSASQPEKVSADTVLKSTIELAKVLNLYPDKKSYQFNMSVRGKITDMSFSESQKELGTLKEQLASFEKDASDIA